MSLPELVDEIFHHRSWTCFVTCTSSVLPFQSLDTRFASGVHVVTVVLSKSISSYVSAAAIHGRGGKRPSVLVLRGRRIDETEWRERLVAKDAFCCLCVHRNS